MEFKNKALKARPALIIATLLAGTTLGSLGVGSLVATAMAGNAPREIVAKPPCVLMPQCRAVAAAPEEQADTSLTNPPTLDTLALHAALQNSSGFGLLRALHEPDPTKDPHQKWCKN